MAATERAFTPEDMIEVNVTLRFDPRAVDCLHCPLLETYARKQCRYTGEYIVVEKATGVFCPFKLTNEQRNKILLAKEI